MYLIGVNCIYLYTQGIHFICAVVNAYRSMLLLRVSRKQSRSGFPLMLYGVPVTLDIFVILFLSL